MEVDTTPPDDELILDAVTAEECDPEGTMASPDAAPLPVGDSFQEKLEEFKVGLHILNEDHLEMSSAIDILRRHLSIISREYICEKKSQLKQVNISSYFQK